VNANRNLWHVDFGTMQFLAAIGNQLTVVNIRIAGEPCSACGFLPQAPPRPVPILDGELANDSVELIA
jgi:hypothetical protein